MPGRALASLVALLVPLAVSSAQPSEAFEKSVRPVLLEHCVSCHGAGGKKVKGGLALTSRAGLLAGGDTGPALVPGDAAKSLVVGVLRYDGEMKMPPKGKLKDHEIAAVTAWVNAGAPWPADATTVAPPTKAETPPAEDPAKFWAFRPVADPAVPPGAKNPIDAFLRAKLDAQKLSPAPPATPAVWLRRVTFDLTGLPPTPAELDAFERDPSPAVRAAVVERLLASPHYGERWGRHWLDVARYADSNGLDENTYFGNAWRYRDYVVASFNADKPFDRFVQEQLAGDLLPKSDDPAVMLERFTALGYLSVGPKLLAEPDKQKMLLDIADEQLDAVSKGLLGLTVACARCHDHKFDPIPARDYYALLAVFTSTRTMQNLNTVAKAYERKFSPADSPQVKAMRERLVAVRRDLRQLEKQSGKATDEAKKRAIQREVAGKRAVLRWAAKMLPEEVAVLGVEEGSAAAYNTQPRNLYVQARGNYVTPLEEAPPRFLRAICGESAVPFVTTKPNPADKPAPNATRFGQLRAGSGRLELARWLTAPDHPLTARVFVNRVWRHHFGEGLVRSVDNFGRLGERPTHPELLDWLATRFAADGWSVKALHRRILLSDAYAMGQAAAPTSDPENRLLGYYPRRRLEAEPLRDAMLAVAGTLDRARGGSPHDGANLDYVGAPNYDTDRRSVYLPVLRSKVFDFFQTFDFPDPSAPNGRRESTVVAPQSLFLMNNPFVRRQAVALAGRVRREAAGDEARVRLAYRLAYARDPRPEELARALGYLKRGPDAWPDFAQAILASNEFQYLN